MTTKHTPEQPTQRPEHVQVQTPDHAPDQQTPERPTMASTPPAEKRASAPTAASTEPLTRQRTWRDRLLSENLRVSASLLLAFIPGVAFVLSFPQLNTILGDGEDRIWGMIILLVVIVGLYSLLFAGMTVLALQQQPRDRLLAVARLPHARRQVMLYRYFAARSSAFSEVLQVMIIAALAIAMLAMRPEQVPLELLLVLTIGSVIAAWLSTVVTFALEYAAADSRGEGFDLNATPPAERGLSEYLYAAMLVQTSSGPTDLVPRTRQTRTLVRNQAILAYVMNTVIVSVGVSVLLTVFG